MQTNTDQEDGWQPSAEHRIDIDLASEEPDILDEYIGRGAIP